MTCSNISSKKVFCRGLLWQLCGYCSNVSGASIVYCNLLKDRIETHAKRCCDLDFSSLCLAFFTTTRVNCAIRQLSQLLYPTATYTYYHVALCYHRQHHRTLYKHAGASACHGVLNASWKKKKWWLQALNLVSFSYWKAWLQFLFVVEVAGTKSRVFMALHFGIPRWVMRFE